MIAAKALDRPAPLTLVVVWQMGAAIAKVGSEDTAFAERSASFMVSIDGNWTNPVFNTNNIAWVRSAWAEINRFGTGGVYLNFTGLADEAANTGVDSAFGHNLRRLAEIKTTYDPDNLFRRNNNINPTT